MSLLDQLMPLNLAEEKDKFFADNGYNPQFTFAVPIDQSTLTQYGVPKKEYQELAQKILDKAYFGRNYLDLQMSEGRVVNEAEVAEKMFQFLKLHGLENRFRIVWSASFISRATITSDTIKLRRGAEFREEGLLSVIYHEIGTHALRRINYEQQPWYQKRKEYGLNQLYLPTEEGLATLHSMFPKTTNLAYHTAVRYVAVHYAQTHSFAQLWKFLGHYITDVDMRWMICFRQKRGIADTSKGGGYTKDLVYFEGAIKVWHWLKQHDFKLDDVYIGKIGIEDVPAALKINPNFKPLLPSFYIADPERYRKKINHLGEVNGFEAVDPTL